MRDFGKPAVRRRQAPRLSPMLSRTPTCVAAATAADAAARCPFTVDGRTVGSVACAHLGALRRWPLAFDIGAAGVALTVPPPGRSALLAEVHAALRQSGQLRGWRDEIFPLIDPATGAVLAHIERAAARFWGALTLGAHATGYVAGADGRPAQLWIAQRALNKSTDPGLFDNLIGGGVPAGQSPAEALVREAFEEAGLRPDELRAVRPAGVLRLQRDVAEGFQHEWLHCFDLELPAGREPCNQDGEVAGFTLMPVAQAMALASGSAMTVDSALVTIDFLLRHDLLNAPAVANALDRLRVVHGP
jgi:8-oxo-dGTP pyrophosphatase MutT (NUDIX family)